MASEKKLFRETRIYPIIFMLIITVIFIGILATFYQLTLDKVTKYKDTMMKKMVLESFNIPTENVEMDFQKYIATIKMDTFIHYEAEVDSIFLGYCFPISGSGLWGTIQALLAVTPEFDKLINIEIVEQNETPGLGGRITESWFKDQFQGKVMIANDVIQSFSMIPENESGNGMEINQITGATASSKAVVDMIYENVKKYRPKLRTDL